MGVLVLSQRSTAPLTLDQLKAQYVDRKFGLFLHFNMSTFVDADWAEPTQSVNTFNPSSLNIDQWVSTAQAMKAKYACLTTKHHDGFCLWPSATTTHDIAATSWYAANGNTDIVSQFVTKFRAAGIPPLLYFSLWDRRFQLDNPSYTKAAYKSFLEAQMTELLTNYGSIAALWFDGGEWQLGQDHPGELAYPWTDATERNAFVQGIQSQCLVVDNAHDYTTVTDIKVYEGGTFGDAVPSNNTTPAEFVDTMRTDGNWFWKSTGNAIDDASTILTTLSTVNSRNAAFMLNAGPDNTGAIPSNMVSVLTTVGASL